MGYIYEFVDDMTKSRSNCDCTVFRTAQEALQAAEYQFRYLTQKDIRDRDYFGVLKRPEEEEENTLEGDPVKEWIINGKLVE